VLKAADRHARAADAYKAALQLQPDHPTAHYKLASVLKQLGKHQAAAHHYRCEHVQQHNNCWHLTSAWFSWLNANTVHKQQYRTCRWFHLEQRSPAAVDSSASCLRLIEPAQNIARTLLLLLLQGAVAA
jgi:tetratricopeptide (TPR) repeat protein